MQYTINPTRANPEFLPLHPVSRSRGTEANLGQRFSLPWFLFRVILCALPAAGLLGLGHASLAGYYFWAALVAVLFTAVLRGRQDEVLALLIALAPFLNLLRAFAFYNVIIVLFGGAWLGYYMRASGIIRSTYKKVPLIKGIFVYVVLYYGLSFFNTRDYSVNLRLFELAFTISFILILSRNPALLGAALTGMIISAWGVGISMLPHLASGARLGVISLDGKTLGNPTQLGIPLAFGFLAIVVDRSLWLNLQSKLVRWSMLAVTLPLLALTTSRSSWLVAAGGVFLCILLGGRQRFKMLAVIAIAAALIQGVLISPFGASLNKGITRTFSEKGSARHRTSGRSDQWLVAYHAFSHSPATMAIGYGPGNGAEVYADHSREVEGVKYAVGKKVALHSLFMQMAVETGALGVIALIAWLLLCFVKVFQFTFQSGATFPLVCFVGYVFIVITVSGNDINSGIFLGIALLGAMRVPAINQGIRRFAYQPRQGIILSDVAVRA
jgi:O-antigen ligase